MSLALLFAGLVLIILGFVIPLQLLWIIGIVLAVLGAALYLFGYRSVGFSRTAPRRR